MEKKEAIKRIKFIKSGINSLKEEAEIKKANEEIKRFNDFLKKDNQNIKPVPYLKNNNRLNPKLTKIINDNIKSSKTEEDKKAWQTVQKEFDIYKNREIKKEFKIYKNR